jgi:YD repeat-containing protein
MIMRTLFFFLLLAVCPLFADPKDPYSLAVTEGEPATLVEGCVSAITGDLYLTEEDALIQGYVPLRLPRQYLSGDGKGTLASWSFTNHLKATYKGGETEHKITVQEPNGSTFIFKCPAEEVYNHFQKKKHPPKFRPPSAHETPGLTNTAQGEISGHSNLKNACVRLEDKGKYLTVHCSDQTTRRYKVHHSRKHFKDVFKRDESKKKIKYLLESETLPSGHKVIYNYDKQDRLDNIRTTNPSTNHTYASATFHYQHTHADKIPNVDISLSDGRTLRYRYEEKEKDLFLLRVVASPESPEENIFYYPRNHYSGNLVSRITLRSSKLNQT